MRLLRISIISFVIMLVFGCVLFGFLQLNVPKIALYLSFDAIPKNETLEVLVFDVRDENFTKSGEVQQETERLLALYGIGDEFSEKLGLSWFHQKVDAEALTVLKDMPLCQLGLTTPDGPRILFGHNDKIVVGFVLDKPKGILGFTPYLSGYFPGIGNASPCRPLDKIRFSNLVQAIISARFSM